MKWLGKVLRVVHRLVPYAAALLALQGSPECAALLQSQLGVAPQGELTEALLGR